MNLIISENALNNNIGIDLKFTIDESNEMVKILIISSVEAEYYRELKGSYKNLNVEKKNISKG